MSLQTIFDEIKKRAEKAAPLGHTLKFNLGSKSILLDGTGETNVVSYNTEKADCTINIKPEDFSEIMAGSLNPMTAFMTGKISVEGDMGVAMKLQTLFS